MSGSVEQSENTYRLVANPGTGAAEHFIEFQAPNLQAAMHVAEHHFVGQETEVYCNGRSLGRLFINEIGGYWKLSPPYAPELIVTRDDEYWLRRIPRLTGAPASHPSDYPRGVAES